MKNILLIAALLFLNVATAQTNVKLNGNVYVPIKVERDAGRGTRANQSFFNNTVSLKGNATIITSHEPAVNTHSIIFLIMEWVFFIIQTNKF